MTFDEVTQEMALQSQKLRVKEAELAKKRYQVLPLKDKTGRFQAELDRTSFVESACADLQAEVDKLRDEMLRLGYVAQYMVKHG